MEALAGFFNQVMANKCVAVTSVASRGEILECKLDPQKAELLKLLFKRRNVQALDVTARIMDIAHEIRNYYQELKDSKESALNTIELPDTIHLATAIFFQCDAFYTFDDSNDKKSKKRGLIALSGRIAERYRMKICKPESDQLGLPMS